jgi:hypothetical protein
MSKIQTMRASEDKNADKISKNGWIGAIPTVVKVVTGPN